MKMARTAGGSGSLTVRLFAPGMTALHRVGLAGLAMTLQALESDGTAERLRALGDWETDDQEVTLRWHEDGGAFFAALLAASFRLADNGLIWFAALGDPLDAPQASVTLHGAMLSTFLQHAPTTRDSAKAQVSLNVGGEEAAVVVRYLPLRAYKHQGVGWGKRSGLRFDGVTPVELAGWLYPGGVVRHNQAASDTALREPPERVLALLYAPVGAIFFQVRRRVAGVRPEYSIVLPEVRGLLDYAQDRKVFLRGGAAQLQVSGAAEAAARVLSEFQAQDLLRAVGADRCTVIAFGTVPWSKQQKTRVQIFEVRNLERAQLRAYRAASQVLKPEEVAGEPDAHGQRPLWWSVPQTPDLVAENAIRGTPWWRGFAVMWQKLRDEAQGAQKARVLRWEQEGLAKMVHEAGVLTDGPEATLVRACQEAWRRRLGQLGQRASETGTPFGRLYEREYERVRISFARCKNAAMLRQTLTDFWARAGAQPALQEGWPALLPLLAGRWQEARDLALLALASYRRPDSERIDAVNAAVDVQEVQG